ncbi:MAG: hypothetical protein M3Q42_11785 [Pseudomonadota bacterium]|nr:hypothetical protein [Pseudomonadota bacterium]
MSGYLLYFPGNAGILADPLAACGLADLARDRGPEVVPIERGPDGRPGRLATWRGGNAASDVPPLILPSQDWQPCRPASGLAEGAYWLGFDRQRPVKPQDLQRDKLHAGYWLKLHDGQEWHVPAATHLPHTHGLGPGGGYARQVAPQHRAFWERSRSYAESIFTALGQLELLQALRGKQAPQSITIELEVEQLFGLAVEALALNYRVNAEIASRLNLLDDEALRNVPMLIVSLPELLKHDEKKKAGLDLGRGWLAHQLWRRGLAPDHHATWADMVWLLRS